MYRRAGEVVGAGDCDLLEVISIRKERGKQKSSAVQVAVFYSRTVMGEGRCDGGTKAAMAEIQDAENAYFRVWKLPAMVCDQ